MTHLPDEEGANIYPFHRDILVDGALVERYNIMSSTVRLSDNRTLTVDDTINILNSAM
jgi:hypothetical protein